MLPALFAFFAGALTVLSPCVLPVVPFLFAQGHRPFRSHTLPMLASMAVSFALVASLAAFGGAWAVRTHDGARYAAMLLLALFGLSLLLPRLAERLTRPLVRLGDRLSGTAQRSRMAPVAMGAGVALLWTPCAGPILGLLLAGAALDGPAVRSSLLLLAFAAGTCTALALATWSARRAGGLLRVAPAIGPLRRLLGIAVLVAVAISAAGPNTPFFPGPSLAAATRLEQALATRIAPAPAPAPAASSAAGGPLSALGQAGEWINSPPLDAQSLRGKVVLVNFWTYSCINCLRTLPYLRAWHQKYAEAGLVVLGIHTPEFAFEKLPANVQRAVADLGIGYPVATDNRFAIWRAFGNRAWPGFHFIDANGRLRAEVAGEHAYAKSEQMIRTLLAEAGRNEPAGERPVDPAGAGTQAPPDLAALSSAETYLGFEKASGFASPASLGRQRPTLYALPKAIGSGQWALEGLWRVDAERSVLLQPQGRIVHRFRARDLHLVLSPAADGRPVRFKVRLDGRPVGEDRGTDVDAQGEGVIDRPKLYQLVRQRTPDRERLFEIEFDGEGAEAYAFTFG